MSFKLGDYEVSDDNDVCFVAEVGSFFNKDVSLAKSYIDMSMAAGVDVFKTEVIHNGEFVIDREDIVVKYNTGQGEVTEKYRDLIDRKIISLKVYEDIFAHALSYGARIIATVFDNTGVDFLKNNGAVGIKISRNNLKHRPLIEYSAKSGLPIIFDVGDVPWWTAQRALEWVREAGGDAMFNHHPGPNPSPAEIHNLRCIENLKKMLGTPVGLACHYRGNEMIYCAIGAGINLIEKGVDIDPTRQEADLISAVSFEGLKELVENSKLCSRSLGSVHPQVHEERVVPTQPGLVASRDIAAGEMLQGNFHFSWPPEGIPGDQAELVLAKTLIKDVAAGEPISWDHFLSSNSTS